MIDDSVNPYSAPESLAMPPRPVEGRPWGLWASLGWTLLIILLMVLLQITVTIAYAVGLAATGRNVNRALLEQNGNLFAFAILACAVAVALAVALLCYLRRLSIVDYLALNKRPSGRQALAWLAGLGACIAISDSTSYALGRPIVPPYMVELYRSAWLPLLCPAVLLFSPAWEETLMRGFFFTGVVRSRWGVGWAIFLSSAIWAILHTQYDWYGIGTVFLLGIYLGAARHLSGSLLLVIGLHSAANVAATIEAVILAR